MKRRFDYPKGLSIVLALVLLFTAVPFTAFANNTESQPLSIEESLVGGEEGTSPEEDVAENGEEENLGNLDPEVSEDGLASDVEVQIGQPENILSGEGAFGATTLMQLAPRVSGTISSIFPDPLFASHIAGLLGKSVSSTVTQNELNTITQVNPSGAVHNVEGIQ